jgi:predicted secreted protein
LQTHSIDASSLRKKNHLKEKENVTIMRRQMNALSNTLHDKRSKKVIFLSHCILNENTRYLGGAFREGLIKEIVEVIQDHGIGIVQMKCPEKQAWGGVLKPSMWVPLYRKHRVIPTILLPLFIWNTRRKYKRMAKDVVKEIKDYTASGFTVVGVVGVSASPTCGVRSSLDMRKFCRFLQRSRLEDITREQVNKQVTTDCLVSRSGMFIDEIKKQIERSNLHVPLYEHDLQREIHGDIISFEL